MTSRHAAAISDWLAADPDATTRAELEALIANDPTAAEGLFADRLTFGTAGLRGPLGAGPSRMNRVVVRMAAWALGMRLLDDHRGGLVVVGFDARPNSNHFALDTARVLVALGLDAEVTDDVTATPVLAHSLRDRDAIAGVMVTASHNPPGDNGYKVYWSHGAQIVPPVDRDIEALIASRGPLRDDELAALADITIVPAATRISRYLDDVIDPLPARSTRGTAVPPSTVYTPMHGVGGATVLAAFDRRGLPPPHTVDEQFQPDGTFPTVRLPNPEEDGALDLSYATAESCGADLILANDPDADRLGAAVRRPDGWRELSGDEIGTLLADRLLELGTGDHRVVACSIVSSTALDRVAAHHGVELRRTLTGFKWIIRASIDEPELDYVFGYEEALGFATSDAVRDKDGVSAAIVLSELAADLRERGVDLVDRLDEIAERDGLVVTRPVSVRYDGDSSAVASLMARIRSAPPSALGRKPVVAITDWFEKPNSADIVEVDLGDAGRVLIRPSGTEPKIKAYIEVATDDVGDVDEARSALDRRLDDIAAAARSLLTT